MYVSVCVRVFARGRASSQFEAGSLPAPTKGRSRLSLKCESPCDTLAHAEDALADADALALAAEALRARSLLVFGALALSSSAHLLFDKFLDALTCCSLAVRAREHASALDARALTNLRARAQTDDNARVSRVLAHLMHRLLAHAFSSSLSSGTTFSSLRSPTRPQAHARAPTLTPCAPG
eukprot:6190492-Pleurochrysis_carterae.AAC.1